MPMFLKLSATTLITVFVAALLAMALVGISFFTSIRIPYCGLPLFPGFYIAGLALPPGPFDGPPGGNLLAIGLSIDVCFYTCLFLALPKLAHALRRESEFARRYRR